MNVQDFSVFLNWCTYINDNVLVESGKKNQNKTKNSIDARRSASL